MYHSQINNTRHELDFSWRYANGDRESPLNFGLLRTGDVRDHTNMNKSSPEGADASLGYQNSWSGDNFGEANDVTYQVRIDIDSEISLSTDNPSTDFSSQIHLINLDRNGKFMGYVKGSDSSGKGALVKANVRKGHYAIVVEGRSKGDMGDFKLIVIAVPVNDATAIFAQILKSYYGEKRK